MTNGIKTEDLMRTLEQAKGLERDYLKEVCASRRHAWRLCFASLGLATLSILAVVGLTPLKAPPEMYVVRVDNATGKIERVSRLGEHEEDYGERAAKYWLNLYVLNCEGYNWYSIQHQHDTCVLLSSVDVQRAYSKKFEGEQGLQQVLANHTNIDVDVHSITLSSNNTAVVRFTTTRRDNTGMRAESPRHQLATVSYQYINAEMEDNVALINPAGFQVLRYRVDADLSRQ